MADPINTPGTTANPNANTTTTTPGATTAPGTTTGATAGTTGAYDAQKVRVEPAATETVHNDKAATKGLIVGVLTFLALSLWEWLDGPADAETNAGAALDSITLPEMLIYAVVGIIVGVIVKAIDKALQKKKRTV